MPSANEPSPDLFDAEDNLAAPLDPEPQFPFAPSAPPPSKKSKKKSKKKDANRGVGVVKTGEGEDSPYGTPPQDDGVRVEELVEPEEKGISEEAAGVQAERVPSPAPALVPPPRDVPPVVKSPRLAQARPVQTAAHTPPSRPASLYGQSQQQQQHYSSLGGFLPNRTVASPPGNLLQGPGSSARPSPPAPLSRRESATHASPRPRFVEPVAPPHKAQPHFYGLPDFGLSFGQQKMDPTSSGKLAGSDGYCCTFDSFADGGDPLSGKRAKDALLVGSDGGLEIYCLAKTAEVCGRLEGLRGSVVGATVLPQVSLEDSMQRLRPLVAVIVHGPVAEEGNEWATDDEPPAYYQTSVEVYSMQQQSHVATLYRSAPVTVEKPTLRHLASIPGPVGDLTVAAEGKYVIVASGKSGEVFVFSNAATTENADEQFRCLGKFWTSLQTSPTTAPSRPQSSSEGGSTAEEKDERAGVPVFSLSQRWLALMAPSTSAHVSIGGTPILLDSNPITPGLASHVAPPQPPISCDIAGVDAEGTWGRLTRQAAQGLVKYSHIGFEMGRQGWRELTNPAPQSAGHHSRGASREHEGFPPTMAPADDPRGVVKEPAIVSIIDLDTLLEAEMLKPKYAPAPLATFALQEGCNYLALSSSGLKLLSVSRSGKGSTIWDLAQACHGTARFGLSPVEDEDTAQGPCVKQLYRFERNSESIVVDAAWSRDDDMLAVLTTHGTVHLHEIPTKPSRKRKRRSTSTAVLNPPQPEKAQPTVSVSQGMSPPSSNGWMGTLKSGFQQVSTQVSTVRTQSSMPSFRPTFAGFREITATAGQVGGRAIARGLNQGYTAAKGGVGDYWYAEANKIRHAALRELDGAKLRGRVRWVRRQEGSEVAVASEGFAWMHPVELYERKRGEEVVSGLRHYGGGKKKFALLPIRTAGSGGGEGRRDDACKKEGVHGFWSLRAAVSDMAGRGEIVPPALQAHEVETNPPYCPFHVDSRVGIYGFDDAVAGSAAEDFGTQGHGLNEEEPWVFGAPLPGSVKLNSSSHDMGPHDGGGEGLDSDDELAGQVESRLTVFGEDEVRVHTRPRAGGGEVRGDGDDGFAEVFDEDGI